MKYAIALAFALVAGPLVSGCASIGSNYDETAVSRLVPGMDKAQVIAMLGRPTTTITLAGGSQHVNWTYSHGSMLGARARSLTLLFGPDGKFVQMVSEANTDLR